MTFVGSVGAGNAVPEIPNRTVPTPQAGRPAPAASGLDQAAPQPEVQPAGPSGGVDLGAVLAATDSAALAAGIGLLFDVRA